MLKKILKNLGIFQAAKNLHYWLFNFLKRASNSIQPTGIILLYHRVAEVTQDPYKLSVSPENFKKQLTYIKSHYNVISLKQLIDDLKNKTLKDKSLVITFDDGYQDNFNNALPILEELNIPATIFVTTGYIDTETEFHWEHNLPLSDQGRSLTTEQLRELSSNPIIELGAHTVSHPKLSNLDSETQRKEIRGSKEALENALKRKIISFAYPFGDNKSFNQTSINIVKESGFEYACSNIHERVKESSDIYALPRYVVRNWNTEEFKENLNNFI
jgi:peptidoglycan/xylan/chitin deacetylase (PgdA/CDA1 family)